MAQLPGADQRGHRGVGGRGDFSQSPAIVLERLTPGTIYNVRLRALGGSTGYSDWSVAAALMAT